MLGVQPPQERHAPAAARSRAEALADQRRNGGVVALQEGADLPQGDMKAEANVVVWPHGGC